MIRTNRSAIVKGQKNSFYKNKTKNNNNFKKYNRTTRSEQKFYKGKNKIESDKKRSKTPMATRYSKFSGNRKLKSNKFSKTHMNNRSILNRKNKNFSTQRTFNNTSNGRLMTVESNSLNKRYFNSGFPQFKRRSDELGPVITKRKFMQNTQNFFPQRQLHLLKRDSDSFADREREKGFFNRITLYPKNIEQDETHSLKGDTLNPYSTNWPSNFLKIGYSSGFYYDDYQDGVPILRLKRLRNKIILPPIQNTRYSNIFQKTGEIPSSNFKYMPRQERINYILNTENNDENNVFKSQNARRKLLDKFNIKGFDLPTIENKKNEEEDEESNEDEEKEEEEDEDEEKEDEEKEDEEDEDSQNNDEKNEEEDEGSSAHPNEID